MFVYILLLGAIVAAFFANDGAALILTPILLAKMKYLKMKPLAIFASILVLWIYFRKDIPFSIDVSTLPEPSSVIKNQTMFKFSWFFLALLVIGYFIGDFYNLPVSVFAFGGALVFLAIANHYKAVKPIMTIKAAPWQVVWFSIGLYVVVYGLKNAGLTDIIASWIMELNTHGTTIAIIGTKLYNGITNEKNSFIITMYLYSTVCG